MSFGASNTTKAAENNLGGVSNLALNNLFPAVTGAGSNLLNVGAGNVSSGTDFLRTVLGGNQANTTAALQPSIDQIRRDTSSTMSGINTLTPRGGGRSGTLFSQSFAPQQQIQNLFNTARSGAATSLPSIGLQQEGLGTNLFGIGGNALGSATGANATLGGLGQQQQQMSNSLFGGLGSGLFNLLTTPLGSGKQSVLNLFGAKV